MGELLAFILGCLHFAPTMPTLATGIVAIFSWNISPTLGFHAY